MLISSQKKSDSNSWKFVGKDVTNLLSRGTYDAKRAKTEPVGF
jgi:hypothetical protein